MKCNDHSWRRLVTATGYSVQVYCVHCLRIRWSANAKLYPIGTLTAEQVQAAVLKRVESK